MPVPLRYGSSVLSDAAFEAAGGFQDAVNQVVEIYRIAKEMLGAMPMPIRSENRIKPKMTVTEEGPRGGNYLLKNAAEKGYATLTKMYPVFVSE